MSDDKAGTQATVTPKPEELSISGDLQIFEVLVEMLGAMITMAKFLPNEAGEELQPSFRKAQESTNQLLSLMRERVARLKEQQEKTEGSK